MSDIDHGRGTVPTKAAGSAFVSLYGAELILNMAGQAVELPRTESGVLALMCGVGRPVHRSELVEALAISTSTLRPVLSRLPNSLGIDGPIHLVDGNRSGHIRLNHDLIHCDAGRIERILANAQPPLTRVESVLHAVKGPILSNRGLVLDHPLVIEAIDRLHQLRTLLTEGRNNLVQRAERVTELDVGGIVLPMLSTVMTEKRRPQPSSIILPELSLVWERAAASAKLGYWDDANKDYRVAIRSARRSNNPTVLARICLEWARIAWDPSIGNEVDDILRGIVDDIEEPSLKAQVQICIYGGTYQSGAAKRGLPSPADFDQMLNRVGQEAGTEDFAWAVIRARKALLGSVPPSESLKMADRVVALGQRLPLIHAQGLQAQFADQMRANRMNQTRLALAELEVLTANPESVLQAMGLLIARSCWNLALGRYEVVQASLAQAIDFRPRIGGPTVDQAIVAQSFWLARERADHDTISALREGALVLAASDQSTPVWAIASAALEVDLGQHEKGLATLESVLDMTIVSHLSGGAHRPGMLALAAETLGAAASVGLSPDPELAEAVLAMLDQEPTRGILFGWPTIYLGSKQRFMGLASLATTRPERARSYLLRAVHEDRNLPPLRARSLEALALTGDTDAADRAAKIRAALERRVEGAAN